MLKVYYANVSDIDPETDREQLSGYRKERLKTIKPLLRRRQGIGAELLLNEAVRRNWPELKLPLEIETTASGKPFCRALPGHFSLSHSGDYAVCAVSSHPLGVDIQKKEDCREGFPERFFAPDEQAAVLNAMDRDAEFTRLWTLKESYLKAIGSGLSVPLNAFSVLKEARAGTCSFWYTAIGEYRLAVCVCGSSILYPNEFEEIHLKNGTQGVAI